MGAQGGQDGGDHRRVVGEADAGEDVGNGVDGHDEIGQRPQHDPLGGDGRLGVLGGVPGGQGLPCKGNARGGAAQFGPEAFFHAHFIDPLHGWDQGLFRIDGVGHGFGGRWFGFGGHGR
ncbi:hypothetical protein D3C72_2089430 [compost metagenome]